MYDYILELFDHFDLDLPNSRSSDLFFHHQHNRRRELVMDCLHHKHPIDLNIDKSLDYFYLSKERPFHNRYSSLSTTNQETHQN